MEMLKEDVYHIMTTYSYLLESGCEIENDDKVSVLRLKQNSDGI